MKPNKGGRPKNSKNQKEPLRRIYVQESRIFVVKLIKLCSVDSFNKLKKAILEALK